MINVSYDPMLIAILPLAMSVGYDIEIEGVEGVDAFLLENVLEANALYESWFGSGANLIKIKTQTYRHNSSCGTKSIGSFYSGGVDSLFNIAGRLQEKLQPVEFCILVRGMDISVRDNPLWRSVKQNLTKAIEHSKTLKFVWVETNARDFQAQRVRWTDTGFGPMLGAISNFLSNGLQQTVVGSYGLYSELEPHASGPLIDRLWSSSAVNVVHYSPRYSRLDKLKIIADQTPELLKILRVCWKNSNGLYNCGICEKCLRTKTEINLIDSEELVQSFGSYDIHEDLELLKGQIPFDSYTKFFWMDLMERSNDYTIKELIGQALKYHQKQKLEQRLRQVIRKYVLFRC